VLFPNSLSLRLEACFTKPVLLDDLRQAGVIIAAWETQETVTVQRKEKYREKPEASNPFPACNSAPHP
jgi:hypothetical protein